MRECAVVRVRVRVRVKLTLSSSSTIDRRHRLRSSSKGERSTPPETSLRVPCRPLRERTGRPHGRPAGQEGSPSTPRLNG
jgi:hypothetical protein